MNSDRSLESNTASWAIGDIHGCAHTLKALMAEIESIDPTASYLFVGDLVGKGPHSLEVLELVKELADRAVLVLGNHDLHLLAVRRQIVPPRPGDQLDQVLQCSSWDWDSWLRDSPLVYQLPTSNGRPWIATHAGIHPTWTLQETIRQGQLVSEGLSEDNWHWYRNEATPAGYAAQILTRMRSLQLDGTPITEFSGSLDEIEEPARAWFQFPGVVGAEYNTVSGHWAALGLHHHGPHFCIDAGCVYGGSLVGLNLETEQIIEIPRHEDDQI